MNDIHPDTDVAQTGLSNLIVYCTLALYPLKAIKMYLKYSAGYLGYLFTKLQSLTQDFKVSPWFEGL